MTAIARVALLRGDDTIGFVRLAVTTQHVLRPQESTANFSAPSDYGLIVNNGTWHSARHFRLTVQVCFRNAIIAQLLTVLANARHAI